MDTVKYEPGIGIELDKHDAQVRRDRDDQISLCLKLIDRASGLIAVAHAELKSLLIGE